MPIVSAWPFISGDRIKRLFVCVVRKEEDSMIIRSPEPELRDPIHADAHDFDSHTSDLEEISRKVFSAHFGQLSIIFLWLSGMYFHGARFSNYEAWLSDPTHIGPSAQVVWPIVGQEILNGDVGGGYRNRVIYILIMRKGRSSLLLGCEAVSNQTTQQALALPEKEVIQPHLPIRLPCYDFTPVTSPAFGIPLLTVKVTTSGMASSHSVTGGVYKARE
ncbi:hypothetical protein HN873_008664 [Arachis hypogaea]